MKLGRSLVAGIESSERALSIVHGVIQICNGTLDILVIAKGVENGYEQDALSQIGMSLLQGPHFALRSAGSKPLGQRRRR